MSTDNVYDEELNYLIEYAEMSPVYFIPVRDAAEKIAGKDSTEPQVQAITLQLIGDMLDRGVQIGDMSPREDEAFVPWGLPREQALHRVATEMQQYEDPLDFVKICWFSAA
ncbi:hypothetical protein ADK70_31445 [Streptomyces rimosus subsp. pseudoverticillatus]|uniref:hypothetical protein n=1 Tax=Streptomyces rimosus TaxID=1927 RepID=UPI0006B29A3B|nr:hypothetical protein [Streptomyces rimosus]KOT79199.1 hypothetical protein ADK70_31445 [Streptomyces rimosus subsp. pseudoverticillatus]